MIVENLGLDFGVLADTVEVSVAVIMMLGGIYLTHVIQRWADRAGEQPPAANVGLGGGDERYEDRTMRQ
jgi:hypothetical protein